MSTVITFGVWDLFHIGHLQAIQQAARMGDKLIVGVASDECVVLDKGIPPIISLTERKAIVESIRFVDRAICYHVLDFVHVMHPYQPDILAVGGDWGTEQRHVDAERWCRENNCQIVHMNRTEGISTSQIKDKIQGLVSPSTLVFNNRSYR